MITQLQECTNTTLLIKLRSLNIMALYHFNFGGGDCGNSSQITGLLQRGTLSSTG